MEELGFGGTLFLNSMPVISGTDLGRFRLRCRNQTTIPTPIPESELESFCSSVRFGGVGIGVGIVVIGIGIRVGIVVIGIGVGIA